MTSRPAALHASSTRLGGARRRVYFMVATPLLATPLLAALLLAAATSVAGATEISVVGLFPGKAVLVIDGAAPKTYSVGTQVTEGVRLLAASEDGATVSIQGKRQVIPLGSHVNRVPNAGADRITLRADAQGHYITQGQINGGSVRMLVDTGATLISLPAAEALRLGIDYRRGQPAMVSTANGTAPVYRVKLDSVRVGEIVLNQVDAVVQESGLPLILLGMSFLSRTDMDRSGDRLTLSKRF
jgi:aspartyl protease family protein